MCILESVNEIGIIARVSGDFVGFTSVITQLGCWEETDDVCKSRAFVVYCFYKINLMFQFFNGPIKERFLSQQGVQIISVIL